MLSYLAERRSVRFMYDEVHSKSICSALTTDDKACGKKIAGKNATNMKLIKPATIITTPGCCPV